MTSLFRFDSVWRLPADPGTIYTVLSDVEAYPLWWSQIKSARELGPHQAAARIRSLLPFPLRLTIRGEVTDPDAGLLRLAIDGDLDGWAQWELRRIGPETLASYVQEVVLRLPAAGQVSDLIRPLLRVNHAWMMRSGERGLASYLTRSVTNS